MSGTSLDGVDMAIVDFYIKKNKCKFKLLEFKTLKYSTDLQKQLSVAHNFDINQIKKPRIWLFTWDSHVGNVEFLKKLKVFF